MGNEHTVVAGASGCVGQRLVERLLDGGDTVVAVCRHPDRIEWPESSVGTLILASADLARPEPIAEIFATYRPRVAYYLVHSMGGGIVDRDDYVDRDKELAANFSAAAVAQETEQIVYLGGHQPDGGEVSKHLSSRGEVATLLRRAGLAVTELRAGVVIHGESAALRMLGRIVENQDTMLIPPQFNATSHPIAMEDAVDALVAAKRLTPFERDRSFDIGSVEACRYRDIIEWYAEARGLDASLITIPWAPRELIVPYLSSITGEDFGLVWALSGSWGVDLPLHDEAFYERFPELGRTPPREAIHQAVEGTEGRRTQIHPSRSDKAAS